MCLSDCFNLSGLGDCLSLALFDEFLRVVFVQLAYSSAVQPHYAPHARVQKLSDRTTHRTENLFHTTLKLPCTHICHVCSQCIGLDHAVSVASIIRIQQLLQRIVHAHMRT